MAILVLFVLSNCNSTVILQGAWFLSPTNSTTLGGWTDCWQTPVALEDKMSDGDSFFTLRLLLWHPSNGLPLWHHNALQKTHCNITAPSAFGLRTVGVPLLVGVDTWAPPPHPLQPLPYSKQKLLHENWWWCNGLRLCALCRYKMASNSFFTFLMSNVNGQRWEWSSYHIRIELLLSLCNSFSFLCQSLVGCVYRVKKWPLCSVLLKHCMDMCIVFVIVCFLIFLYTY